MSSYTDIAYCGTISVLLGALVGFTYAKAYRGLLLSASFVHTVVVTIPLVTLSVYFIRTASVESSFSGQALAFAMVGLLGLIRFRTVVRDTREFTFIFLSITTGIGLGSGFPVLAVVSCCALLVLLVVLQLIRFGSPSAPSLKVSAAGAADSFAKYLYELEAISTRVDPISFVCSQEAYTYEFEIQARRGHDLASVANAVEKVPGTVSIDVVRLQRGGSKTN